MKNFKSKKIFFVCLMLFLSLFVYVNKVNAEIVVYSEIVDKKEIEGWKEIKPIKMIEIEDGEKSFWDNVIENKWNILGIAGAVIVILIVIIIISVIGKRKYGR